MRPAVIDFSKAMERKLVVNDHKGGWDERHCSVGYLEDRLIQELGEYFKNRDVTELPDIANFCMMIYMRNTGRGDDYLK